MAASIAGCTAPSGYVANDLDCYDASKDVYPGAPVHDGVDYTIGRDGSAYPTATPLAYDYNCDGVETERSTTIYGSGGDYGWKTTVPTCGETGTYASYSWSTGKETDWMGTQQCY